MTDDKARRRHLRTHAFFVWLLTPFLKRKFNLAIESCADIEGPYLVLANHNSDWDPLFVSVTMRKQLYYVASEHIFRLGLPSRLLERFFAPIPRTKGSVESGAAMAVLRHLRKGHSVGIFAEGNKSFNGVTGPIHPSTAKLVRSAGVKLVTLRIEGGYFTTPRWGKGIRRGKMKIARVGVYSAEEIKAMSLGEIDEMLRRDLYEDAYARQELERSRFCDKRRAELLETALFACPVCGEIGTLHGENDTFSCACGLRAVYTEAGLLEGAPYATITAWDAWQRAELVRRLETAQAGEALCADENAVLLRFGADHRETERAEGTLTLYRDRFEFEGRALLFEKIGGLSIYGRNNLVFTFEGDHWEMQGSSRFSALKYQYAYEAARARQRDAVML